MALIVLLIGGIALAGIGWAPSVYPLQGIVVITGVVTFIGLGIAAWRFGWWRPEPRPRANRRLTVFVSTVVVIMFVTTGASLVLGRHGKSHICDGHYCNYVDGAGEIAISPRAYLLDQSAGLIFLAGWSAVLNAAAVAAMSSRSRAPLANPP